MKKLLLFSITLITLISCSKTKLPLEVPNHYDGSNFESRTAAERAVYAQYTDLLMAAQNGRTSGVTVSFSTLSALYNAGDPSLKSLTTPFFATQMDSTAGWLKDLAQSSGNQYIPGTSSTNGGVYHGYLFNEKGLELEQLIEKGLLNAVFYAQAVALMEDGVTVEECDKMLALFGAHPDFSNTPNPARATHPDMLMAQHAARRDDNTQTGLYSQIREAFIRLQAAINAGGDYQEDQDKAAQDVRVLWEKISFATAVHACQQFTALMSQTAPQEPDRARALHHYAEAVGLIYGFRTIPKASKIMSDGEIDVLLSLLRVAPGTQVKSYLFIVDPGNAFPNIYQVEQKIQLKYQFGANEMEGFKKDWVLEQGR